MEDLLAKEEEEEEEERGLSVAERSLLGWKIGKLREEGAEARLRIVLCV